MNACPKCGREIETKTEVPFIGVRNDGSAEEISSQPGRPRSGDVSVCLYCGTIMVFDDARQEREITPEELEALDPRLRNTAVMYSRAIIAGRARRN